jgi:hypothetical protein
MTRPTVKELGKRYEREKAARLAAERGARRKRAELTRLHEVRAWDAETTRLLVEALRKLEHLAPLLGARGGLVGTAAAALAEYERRTGPRTTAPEEGGTFMPPLCHHETARQNERQPQTTTAGVGQALSVLASVLSRGSKTS